MLIGRGPAKSRPFFVLGCLRITNVDWRNLQANAFEGMLAIMAIISGLTALLDPATLADSVVGRTLHPWDYGWTVMFLLSGMLLLLGLLYGTRTWEIWRFHVEAVGAELAGLVFLATALTINGAAAIYISGVSPGLGIFVAVILACVYRARVLITPNKELVAVPISAVVPPESGREQ